jgi:hypothetical protein
VSVETEQNKDRDGDQVTPDGEARQSTAPRQLLRLHVANLSRQLRYQLCEARAPL